MRMLSLVALVMMSCGTTTPPPVETLYEEIHVEGAVEKTTLEDASRQGDESIGAVENDIAGA